MTAAENLDLQAQQDWESGMKDIQRGSPPILSSEEEHC